MISYLIPGSIKSLYELSKIWLSGCHTKLLNQCLICIFRLKRIGNTNSCFQGYIQQPLNKRNMTSLRLMNGITMTIFIC